MTINTTAPTTALARPRVFYATWMPFTGLGLIGMIVMVTPKKRGRAAILLMTLLLMGVLTLLVGCGGGGGPMPNPGTQKGTFTVTVTGTSGNITHSATFSLTVQ